MDYAISRCRFSRNRHSNHYFGKIRTLLFYGQGHQIENYGERKRLAGVDSGATAIFCLFGVPHHSNELGTVHNLCRVRLGNTGNRSVIRKHKIAVPHWIPTHEIVHPRSRVGCNYF